jgi:hydrogenase nickel incorporation protein HypB
MMCAICGCSDEAGFVLTGAAQPQAHGHVHPHTHKHVHAHDHAPGHAHVHGQRAGSTVAIERDLLARNDASAARNRHWFAQHGILALNLVSAPGSGKTSLLERTLADCGRQTVFTVIEGDQATTNDAERIRATGTRAVQINTGAGCHLDADMVAAGLAALAPQDGSTVMIENVGNLVCPALFDLGEQARVAILSVTEGEDKPLKYPHMFRSSQLLLLNKVDLLPHVRFDVERCLEYAHRVQPALVVLQVSATTGQGMGQWYDWLASRTLAGPVARPS